MIDVLDEIRFCKSLLGKDTPTNIANKLKARIAEKELEVLAFEHASMSEMDAKILLASRKKVAKLAK